MLAIQSIHKTMFFQCNHSFTLQSFYALVSPPVAAKELLLSTLLPRSPWTPADGTSASCMPFRAALAGSFLVPTSLLKLALGAPESKPPSVMFLP